MDMHTHPDPGLVTPPPELVVPANGQLVHVRKDFDRYLERLVGPDYAVVRNVYHTMTDNKDKRAAIFAAQDGVRAADPAAWAEKHKRNNFDPMSRGFPKNFLLPDEIWARVLTDNQPGNAAFVGIRFNEYDGKGSKDVNVVRPRTFAIDCDSETSFATAINLIVTGNLPPPSMIVRSSLPHKVHFYWVLDEKSRASFPLPRWKEVQNKLAGKVGSDASVGDYGQVLRLPSTYHFKDLHNPLLATLLYADGPDYHAEEFIAKCGLDLDAAAAGEPPKGHRQDHAMAAALAGVPPRMRARMAERLEKGVHSVFTDGVEDYPPVDIRLAVNECAVLANSFELHGNGDPEPLWHLLMLAATFDLNPHETAHTLSEGYAGYSEAETDKKLQEKEAARAQNDKIGWPSCAAIAATQANSRCKTCRHLSEGKSPLNFLTPPDAAPADSPPQTDDGSASSWVPPSVPSPILPGIYDDQEAVRLFMLNWFFVMEGGKPWYVCRDPVSGALHYSTPRDFSEKVANVKVKVVKTDANGKLVEKIEPAGPWWRQHPARKIYTVVFEPRRALGPDELNSWAGIRIIPLPGRDKMQGWLNHVRKYICRDNDEHFAFLMAWMAHRVQFPEQRPGSKVVLKSIPEGTGKDVIWGPLIRALGIHAFVASHKEHLVGRFTIHLAIAVFVLCQEIFWAGDKKAHDTVKMMTTSETIPRERKGGAITQEANHMGIAFTTNHDHAIEAGPDARRDFVLEPLPLPMTDAQKKIYYDKMIRELTEEGGDGQVLDYLQKLDISKVDFRRPPKTMMLRDQQKKSSSSFIKWLMTCIEDDCVRAVEPVTGAKIAYPLNTWQKACDLGDAYQHSAKSNNHRDALDNIGFGEWMKQFIAYHRITAGGYYFMPRADQLQHIVDRALNPSAYPAPYVFIKPEDGQPPSKSGNVVPFQPPAMTDEERRKMNNAAPEVLRKIADLHRRMQTAKPEEIAEIQREISALINAQISK